MTIGLAALVSLSVISLSVVPLALAGGRRQAEAAFRVDSLDNRLHVGDDGTRVAGMGALDADDAN